MVGRSRCALRSAAPHGAKTLWPGKVRIITALLTPATTASIAEGEDEEAPPQPVKKQQKKKEAAVKRKKGDTDANDILTNALSGLVSN